MMANSRQYFLEYLKCHQQLDSKGLTVVYNTQNYWGFGLCPSSSILETRKHNDSETDPLEWANLNQWTSFRNVVFSSF
jgi:hypothetical protein